MNNKNIIFFCLTSIVLLTAFYTHTRKKQQNLPDQGTTDTVDSPETTEKKAKNNRRHQNRIKTTLSKNSASAPTEQALQADLPTQPIDDTRIETDSLDESESGASASDIQPEPITAQPSPQKKVEDLSYRSMQLLDTIKVVIYTEDGAVIITQSDLQRPSLDGSTQTLEELVFQQLVFQEAKKFKMIPDEETIDKHLKAIQRDNNLTLDQLKDIFKASGYSYEGGRNQLAIMSTISSMIDFKIRSRLIVPEKSITEYYEAHKEVKPAEYEIMRVFVPFSTKVKGSRSLQDALVEFSKTGLGFPEIVWSVPFWVQASSLAEDRQTITHLLPGEISAPFETENGFELFKVSTLKPESVVSLDDSAREIANILRKPLFESHMAEYKKELFDAASIVWF